MESASGAFNCSDCGKLLYKWSANYDYTSWKRYIPHRPLMPLHKARCAEQLWSNRWPYMS